MKATDSAIKISVITVCFNAASTISKTIESVLAQRGACFEYLVVDGISTDGTLDVIAQYRQRIDVFVSERDAGIFDAMNKGIAMSSGDVIYFLNADDSFFDDSVLADVAREFAEDPRRLLIYGQVNVLGAPANARMSPARALVKRSFSEFLHNSFCHQALFARRELFERVGMFDLEFKYAADYEWVTRSFVSHRQGFHFFDRVIANYFFLGRSKLNEHVAKDEVLRMRRRHLASLEYSWFHFRYVLLRGLKKRLLREEF